MLGIHALFIAPFGIATFSWLGLLALVLLIPDECVHCGARPLTALPARSLHRTPAHHVPSLLLLPQPLTLT